MTADIDRGIKRVTTRRGAASHETALRLWLLLASLLVTSCRTTGTLLPFNVASTSGQSCGAHGSTLVCTDFFDGVDAWDLKQLSRVHLAPASEPILYVASTPGTIWAVGEHLLFRLADGAWFPAGRVPSGYGPPHGLVAAAGAPIAILTGAVFDFGAHRAFPFPHAFSPDDNVDRLRAMATDGARVWLGYGSGVHGDGVLASLDLRTGAWHSVKGPDVAGISLSPDGAFVVWQDYEANINRITREQPGDSPRIDRPLAVGSRIQQAVYVEAEHALYYIDHWALHRRADDGTSREIGNAGRMICSNASDQVETVVDQMRVLGPGSFVFATGCGKPVLFRDGAFHELR